MQINNEDKIEIEKQLHSKMELSKNIYLGDIDDLMKTVENQMPVVQHEQIYLWELEKQGKIYLSFIFIAFLMLMLGFLI